MFDFPTLFIFAVLMHLIADLFFQTDAMVKHKTDLHKLDGWLHASIHLQAMLWVFPFGVALAVVISHLLIDTRVPLKMWRQWFRQSAGGIDNPAFVPFAMLQDQAAHVLILALAALFVAR